MIVRSSLIGDNQKGTGRREPPNQKGTARKERPKGSASRLTMTYIANPFANDLISGLLTKETLKEGFWLIRKGFVWNVIQETYFQGYF